MTSLSVARVRDDFAAVLRSVHDGPVEITRHGKTIAVMMDPVVFNHWRDAVEELDDIRAVDSLASEPSTVIPWDEVKRDLGLV